MKITGGKVFSIATLAVFLLSAAGCLWWAPTSILDTHGRDECNAGSPPGTSGRIYLQIEGGTGGNFNMKGTVFVPVWLWPKGVPESEKGSIDLPEMSEDGEVHVPSVPLSVSAPFKTAVDSTEVYQMEVAEPVGFGTLRRYPLDRYWVGIQSARLSLPKQAGEGVASIPLELHVRFDGEPGWDAHRKIGANEVFHEGFDSPYSPTDQTPNARACGLVINRSLWYIGLVGSLVAIMTVPALYVWHRPQEPAGLELIAAILGVATIRTYLIGSPSSVASLLPFDVVLALIVFAVAFIPFWKSNASDEA